MVAGVEKVLTKNRSAYVAIVDARKLDYYHALEAEHTHPQVDVSGAKFRGAKNWRAAWVYPTRLANIVAAFGGYLPDLADVIQSHTRFRLHRPFLNEQQARILYEHHARAAASGIAAVVGMSAGSARGRLSTHTFHVHKS